jgi:adenylate cyclase class IV
MIETEVKIELERREFINLSYKFGNPKGNMQKNIVYNFLGGFIRFRNENGKSILTLKGKRMKHEYNSRLEFEFSIPNNLFSYILKSKLGNFFYYEKIRASVILNGCAVCLDTITEKNFIEIEGSVKNIRKNFDELGLKGKNLERRTYCEIIKNGRYN